MNEKRIDKDNLMNQLFDYLSIEIKELTEKKENFTRKRKQLEDKKNEIVNQLSNQSKVNHIRKVFSPLSFQIQENEHSDIDTSQLDQDISKLNDKESYIDKKIRKLSGYMEGLEETYFIADNQVEVFDEKMPFLPTFHRIVDYVKRMHPEVKIYYDSIVKESNIGFRLSFFKGFELCMRMLISDIGVYVINCEEYIDKYKILIQFEIKPKIPKDVFVFKEKKTTLEQELTKEFSIIRWKTNSIIIQALLE